MLKMDYLSIFFKEVNKHCGNFSRFWTKNANCWEILKIFDENSIEKLNFLFYYFLEDLLVKIEPSETTPLKPCVKFSRVNAKKHKGSENNEKTFKVFEKFSKTFEIFFKN